MLQGLNPRWFTIRQVVSFSLFCMVMTALKFWLVGMSVEAFFRSPWTIASITIMVIMCPFLFVWYWNAPHQDDHFVIDELGKVELAPVGLYWRFKTRWYRGHGGRIIDIPMGVITYPIGRDRVIVVVIDHGYRFDVKRTPEYAERVFRLYQSLEAVMGGTVYEIEEVVRRYRAEGHEYPKVTLDQRGRFIG